MSAVVRARRYFPSSPEKSKLSSLSMSFSIYIHPSYSFSVGTFKSESESGMCDLRVYTPVKMFLLNQGSRTQSNRAAEAFTKIKWVCSLRRIASGISFRGNSSFSICFRRYNCSFSNSFSVKLRVAYCDPDWCSVKVAAAFKKFPILFSSIHSLSLTMIEEGFLSQAGAANKTQRAS